MAVTRDSNKSYISQVKMPSGNTYYFKDADLETAVNGILDTVTQVMHWKGNTTTAISDGSTTGTISIGGSNYAAQVGDVVSYKPSTGQAREYAWNGSSWQEYGSTGSLKALAFKDTASATVSDYATGITKNGTNNTGFTGTAATLKFTPTGEVTVTTNTSDNKTALVTGTDATGTNITYTPKGKVTVPKYTFDPKTSTITPPVSKEVALTVASAAPGATAPANAVTYCAVSGEVLSLYQLGYTKGASVAAGSTSYTVLNSNTKINTENVDYQLVGTGAKLVTGNIPVPKTFTAQFDGDEASVSYTPAGTVDVELAKGSKTITVS